MYFLESKSSRTAVKGCLFSLLYFSPPTFLVLLLDSSKVKKVDFLLTFSRNKVGIKKEIIINYSESGFVCYNKFMSERINKVNDLIRDEVGLLIEKEVVLPPAVIASITQVETSPDLHYAKIWVSIFPVDQAESVLEILNKQAPVLQKFLNKKLKMRYVPRIRFIYDESGPHAERIEALLKQI